MVERSIRKAAAAAAAAAATAQAAFTRFYSYMVGGTLSRIDSFFFSAFYMVLC
jgi:hypothetical protein